MIVASGTLVLPTRDQTQALGSERDGVKTTGSPGNSLEHVFLILKIKVSTKIEQHKSE